MWCSRSHTQVENDVVPIARSGLIWDEVEGSTARRIGEEEAPRMPLPLSLFRQPKTTMPSSLIPILPLAAAKRTSRKRGGMSRIILKHMDWLDELKKLYNALLGNT